MEDLGYPLARAALKALGAVVAGVPVDAQRIVTAALAIRASLVYVTPRISFAFTSQ